MKADEIVLSLSLQSTEQMFKPIKSSADHSRSGKPQYKKKRKSSDNVTREGPPPRQLVTAWGCGADPPPLVTAWGCGPDPP